MDRSKDTCIGVRKTYDAILGFLISIPGGTIVVAASPVVYLLSFLTYNASHPSYISILLTTSGFSIFSVLIVAWIVAGVSIWKNMPNLLTVTIFVYTCLGHWSLVSFLVVMFYGFGNMPLSYSGYLCSILIPSVMLLLFSSDLMRVKRSAMFKELAATALAVEGATAPVVVA